MVFDSFEFFVFLAVVFPLYLVLPHRWQNRMLLVASYFFYGWWSWKFLLLLMATNIVDYWCGIGLGHFRNPRARRALVLVTIVLNMGALAFFKYYNFFAENLHQALAALGLPVSLPVLNVVLPVGISFYTFQEMVYVLDVYRGIVKPERRFVDFALFVTFFPQLVAGPIMRPAELLPQIKAPRTITWEGLRDGGWLIYWGLYKKVFIADNAARIVDRVFGAPENFSATEILIASYAFAAQIYCDFSGYTDIARGLGRIMGFEIVLNFNLPYFARNPSDLWRRWHISLSQFLRDNLYIPLGGNRRGRPREYFNLMATMTLGGLWHGAQWNFVLWGVYHGALLGLQRAVKDIATAWRAGGRRRFDWSAVGRRPETPTGAAPGEPPLMATTGRGAGFTPETGAQHDTTMPPQAAPWSPGSSPAPARAAGPGAGEGAPAGRPARVLPRGLGTTLAILGMFHLTCLGWILFRAESMADIRTIMGKLFSTAWTASPAALSDARTLLLLTAPLMVMQLVQYNMDDLLVMRRAPAWVRVLVYVGIYFSLTLGAPLDGRVFIYFQF